MIESGDLLQSPFLIAGCSASASGGGLGAYAILVDRTPSLSAPTARQSRRASYFQRRFLSIARQRQAIRRQTIAQSP